VTYTSDGLSAHFQRPVLARSSGDAVLDRLRRIGCRAPAGYGDSDRRTVVRINMYAWYGARGERLARAVAALPRAGCRVRVIGSVISAQVVRILKGARIPVRAADWDFGRKLSTSGDKIIFGPRCYSHLKYLTVNGRWDGRGAKVVWTGSENWSAPALSSDEVTLQVHDTAVVQAYDRRFEAMWGSPNATHRTGIQPTRRPCH
jgi:phosphatidylserine/phosphatidylglycerophosphate/cardiolipin synthase-like enzyme